MIPVSDTAMMTLAVSMQGNAGVYALLLGSGISRSASIPTGWEVMLDLIQRVAAADGADPGGDPVQWYRSRFGMPPTYSNLLAQAGPNPALRQGLLRPLFERRGEEESPQDKVPTAAHRAIARLFAGGYVRVAITTNFDRLLELALREEGIEPTVIASDDQAAGSIPLIHLNHVIVKVHGDYLDARIRNTDDELATYGEPMERLLDRVFDEFGMIVCGWSGASDTALRNAVARTPTRRYPWYWVAHSEPSGVGVDVINGRSATVIRADADGFFVDLDERVRAVAALQQIDPLTVSVATTRMKRLIQNRDAPITLHDFFTSEVERVVALLTSEERFPVATRTLSDKTIWAARIQQYDALLDPLTAMLAVGCRWGDTNDRYLWIECLQRVANLPDNWASGTIRSTALLDLRDYPAMRLLYAAGIGAIAGGHFDTFLALLSEPQVGTGRDARPVTSMLQTGRIIHDALVHLHTRGGFATSDHLSEVLWAPLRHVVTDHARFEQVFDQFEVLRFLAGLADSRLAAPRPRVASGRTSPLRQSVVDEGVIGTLWRDFARTGNGWSPLRQGMFGGDFQNALRAFTELAQTVDDQVMAAEITQLEEEIS